MAQQTFSGVPGAFSAGEVLSASDQELLRDYLIAQIKEGQTGDTGEILPMIMDLTNNRIVLDSGGIEFSDATTMTTAASSGEVGTATVAFAAASGTITIHANYNTVGYFKTGRFVHIQGELSVSGISSPSGAFSITGLPYTSANDLTERGDYAGVKVFVRNLAAARISTGGVISQLDANSTTLYVWSGDLGTGATEIADQIDTGTVVTVGGSYIAAA
jgi:hypothetical protein